MKLNNNIMKKKALFLPLLLLQLIIILSPLPFASNREYFWIPLAAISALCLLITYCFAFVFRPEILSIRRIWLAALLYISVIIYAYIQTLPLLELSPDDVRYLAYSALGQEAPQKVAISITPLATIDGIMRLCGYACLFISAYFLCSSSRATKKIVKAIFYSSSFYCAFGLLNWMLGVEHVLGIPKTSYIGDLTSVFFGRNFFALYAACGFFAGLCVIARHLQNIGDNPDFRSKLVDFSAYLGSRKGINILLCLIIVCAIFLTNSRAGIICTMIGAISFILLIGRSGRSKSLLIGIIIIPVFILFLGAGEEIFKRFENVEKHSQIRGNIYRVTVEAIEDNPLLGSGYGSFVEKYALHADDSFVRMTAARVNHAHSTYLENALELGIPAAVILCLSIFVLLIKIYQRIISKDDGRIYAAFALCCWLALGLHSLIDFSLEIPAISSLAAVILAIGMNGGRKEGKR